MPLAFRLSESQAPVSTHPVFPAAEGVMSPAIPESLSVLGHTARETHNQIWLSPEPRLSPQGHSLG